LWSVTPLFLALTLFALGVLWPLPSATPVRTDHPFAFVGATLVDVEQGIPIPGRTVLIDRGRIAAVGPDGTFDLPQRAVRIDARGMYLTPALWDMHTHVFAISPLLDMPLYVAYGVTNVRDMQGCPKADDPFIACAEDKRRWTREAQQGLRVGPRIVASTSFMANGPGMRERLSEVPHFFGTETPEEARAFVRHQAAQGVDAIKVYDRLPREAYFALVEEAKRLGLTVDGRRAYRDFYQKGLELTGAAHRAGVKILAGTDYIVPGADLHRELVQLVAAGLSPAEALKTATLSPALYFGLETEYGSIGPGKVADLLLLEADPLADIRNTQRIRAVVFNGNLYDRRALDGLHARVRARAGSWSVACKILWRFLQQPVSY